MRSVRAPIVSAGADVFIGEEQVVVVAEPILLAILGKDDFVWVLDFICKQVRKNAVSDEHKYR